MLSSGWNKLSGAFSAVHVLPRNEHASDRVKRTHFSTKWFMGCLTVFVIFNFINIFQQTTFMCRLPAINLVKVLNNGQEFLDSGKLYFRDTYDDVKKENIELYNSLSKIFEMQKNSYMKNYHDYALILNPLFILDESEIRIKLHPMKYIYETKTFEFKNSTIPILEFKHVFGRKLTPLKALHRSSVSFSLRIQEHHQDTTDFIHKIIYPIYESSGYPRSAYNLDALLDYSFVLKYINFGVFLFSVVFLAEALCVVVPYSLEYYQVLSIVRLNKTLFVLAVVCFVSNFMLMSVSIVLNMILLGKESNERGVFSTLLGFIQLFWLVFLAFQTKNWVWKVYLEKKYLLPRPEKHERTLSGFGIKPLNFGSLKRHFTHRRGARESQEDLIDTPEPKEPETGHLMSPNIYAGNLHLISNTNSFGTQSCLELKGSPARSIRSARSMHSLRSTRSAAAITSNDRDPFFTAPQHQSDILGPKPNLEPEQRSVHSSSTEVTKMPAGSRTVFVEEDATSMVSRKTAQEHAKSSGLESSVTNRSEPQHSVNQESAAIETQTSQESVNEDEDPATAVAPTNEQNQEDDSTTRISTADSESIEQTQDKHNDDESDVSRGATVGQL
ncbi:hypothetical protein OGAPHI_003857 [Ogataea philodendri]|uniref:Uncharacterized protein n=1 Tax=Ogataea philodendri TaxID=1378263 RepID=A0A9P8P6Q9_9ASCO|nr:uncharacterized protein OGAPHI_003857 [Ogataea philodendri]KAH3665669.1 hypothetical protein OGAPHI_003857 [Ogataea philodendri]